MAPSESTQLLGSPQWPSVQSQPRLQCSTSLLAGQLSAGLVKTIQDEAELRCVPQLRETLSLGGPTFGDHGGARRIISRGLPNNVGFQGCV